jgi:hypothetical protein
MKKSRLIRRLAFIDGMMRKIQIGSL